MTNTMIEAALELAAKGWRVLPCRRKVPLIAGGFHKATADKGQIEQWWTRWPTAQIGGCIPNHLCVLDFDPRTNPDALTELETRVGPLPTTLTSWSGRNDGGRHLFYFRPPGQLTGVRLPDGIDFKVGGSGYVILPPSRHHVSHELYRWESHPIAALPLTVRVLLTPSEWRKSDQRWRRQYTRTDGLAGAAGLIRTVREAAEGNRHDALVWSCFRAKEDDALDLIAEELIAASIETGYPERDARAVVESVRRSES